MTELVDLALPCRLIALNVRLGPERGLTTLEDLAAKAVAAGRTSVEALADLFGLPRRILLDVVHSLWGKSYVIVDLESGLLQLSDSAREILLAGDSLQDASAELAERHFLFEPITGRILPERHGTPRPREPSLQVPLHDGIEVTDLPADELIRAVQAAIRDDRRQGFRKNVLEVGFGSPVLRPPAQLRWLATPASVRVDDDTDRVAVTLADSRRWDSRARQRMRDHLAELADTEPGHSFVRSLRARADKLLEPPESVSALVGRMARMLPELPQLTRAQITPAQDDLEDMAGRLEERIADIDRARAKVSVVNRTAGQRWALDELIKSARSQLVIVSPLITYRALNPLLPALRAALSRGVQLVIIWGRSPGDSLPGFVKTAFDDLADRYGPNLLIADRSARTDACAVIQDDTRALVCSYSPLAIDQKRDMDTLSVLVEPASQAPCAPEAISDLLAWSRRAYPYWRTGQRIRIRRDDLDDSVDTDGTGPVAPSGADTPLPVPPGEAPDELALKLWAASWAEYHAAMTDALRRGDDIGPAVELIKDSDHEDALWRALRGAGRRVIIVDDQADPGVADRIVHALRERAAAGAAIDLICPAAAPGVPASKALTELGEQPVSGIRLRLERKHMRIVVADDEVLAGSFSPLHDDGHHLLRRPDRKSQLGLRIRSATVAAEVAAALPVAAEPAGRDQEDKPPRTRRAATAALPLLVEARREHDRGHFGALVARRLRDLEDPWIVLDAWRDLPVPAAELRPAAAALLRQGTSRDLAAIAPWISWLLVDAWTRSRFVEAALIAGLAGPSEVTPPAAACLAAAPIEHGPLGSALVNPVLELLDHSPTAQLVGAAGALAELMLWGSTVGMDALSLLSEALPPSWQELARAAVKFADTTGGAPVPVALLAAELASSCEVADAAGGWNELATRIDTVEHRRQRLDASNAAMHQALFAPQGLLTRIRAAARTPSLRTVLVPQLPADVRSHLNELVAEAGQEPIKWSRHQPFLNEIADIVRAARSLAPHQATVASANTVINSPACGELVLTAARARDELFSDANAVPHPYGFPLMALLERLDPLARWGQA